MITQVTLRRYHWQCLGCGASGHVDASPLMQQAPHTIAEEIKWDHFMKRARVPIERCSASHKDVTVDWDGKDIPA